MPTGIGYVMASTDAGAPALSGTAGALCTVLDALLVDGYNSHTSGLSITRSGSTATVTKTGHGFVSGHRVANGGWDQAEYNIEAEVTVLDANTYTYQVSGTPATPGTGTGTAKVAPLGWSIAYTGTNVRSYRSKAGTNQFYLGVDHTGTTNARYRAFESMTAAGVAVGSGTNPFPTDVQMSGGLYFYCSSLANSTARAWVLYSNGKYFHFLANPAAATYVSRMGFGDFTSFTAGDAYNTAVEGEVTSANTNTPASCVHTSSSSSVSSGLFIARKASQTGGSAPAGRCAPVAYLASASTAGKPTQGTYPDPVIGGLGMGKSLLFSEAAYTLPRGILPGVWYPCSGGTTIADLDTWSGAVGTPLEGKRFKAFHANNGNGYWVTLETTPALWD